jgi:peptidoglycan/LPS O-acetylase OafA/YrhL
VSLQIGRAIAAVLVVIYHAMFAAEPFVGHIPNAMRIIASRGYLGVDFFFVLSGFIILYSNRNIIDRRKWILKYAEARVFRVFVPYLPIGLGIALIYTVLPALSDSDRTWSWLSTLTLLPVGEPALIVAWTLQFEIVFYLIFWLAISIGRPVAIFALWLAVIVAHFYGFAPWLPEPVAGLICVEFFFGVAAAWVVLGRWADTMAGNVGLATVGAVITFAACNMEGETAVRILIAAAVACVVVPIVRQDLAGKLTAAPRLLLLLGSASYAIYLVHNPIISVIARFGRRFALAPWQAMVVLFVVPTLIGVAYHLSFERPVLDMLRRRLHLRRGPSVSQSKGAAI